MFLTTFLLTVVQTSKASHSNSLFSDCAISECSSEPFEVDHSGKIWPRFCYKCSEGEDQVIFLRSYLDDPSRGWEYTLTNDNLYQGRVLLPIFPCFKPEVDSMGNSWTSWCFGKKLVQFDKIGERVWVYKQDFNGGYPLLQFRRVLFNEVFLQLSSRTGVPVQGSAKIINQKLKTTENNENNLQNQLDSKTPESCIKSEHNNFDGKVIIKHREIEIDRTSCKTIEGDTSGRYFFEEFDEEGEKVTFVKDSKGNFIIRKNDLSRIPENFLQPLPVHKESRIPCKILSPEGELLLLEPDIFILNMFWRKEFINGQPVKFQKSSEDVDKWQGMYIINKNTGKREVFNDFNY